ncbi:MAG: ABC transporter substrate-binding protein, partial [Candidatus Sumerlaeota bacterium]|nr:ABC transporter substrate-binding protein [Candidatus Sumerlaeota bacterium]
MGRAVHFIMGISVVCVLALVGCAKNDERPRVVVYCSLDRIFSEPVLQAFEKDAGIEVEPVFDVEAAKTIGLTQRLIQERGRPLCDVFWNNEILQTVRLGGMGLLEPYASPSASDIPARWRDPQGLWTGFAARARVILFNKNLIAEGDVPTSIRQWGASDRWQGRFAIADPRFGTTSTHMAALYAAWGKEEFERVWKGWQ